MADSDMEKLVVQHDELVDLVDHYLGDISSKLSEILEELRRR